MPSQERYWLDKGRAFVKWKREQDEVTEAWLERMVTNIGRTPTLLEEIGFEPGPSPLKVGVEHIRALKERRGWETNTLATYFCSLRPFLKWVGNPVAEHRGAWRLPSGEPSHRRWLTEDQLVALYLGAVAIAVEPRSRFASGDEGVIRFAPALIACEGFNALRRIEIQRLRVKDLDFSGSRMRVRGKGRGGGKWRRIPKTESTRRVLEPLVQGRALEEFVFPGTIANRPLSGNACDQLIQRAAHRAGFPSNSKGRALVSNHDLRRTFGRIAYYAGMSLVDLKNFYGHESIDMTAHYIGMDEGRMREGIAKFDAKVSGMVHSL